MHERSKNRFGLGICNRIICCASKASLPTNWPRAVRWYPRKFDVSLITSREMSPKVLPEITMFWRHSWPPTITPVTGQAPCNSYKTQAITKDMNLGERPNGNCPSKHFSPKDGLLASQQTFPNCNRLLLVRNNHCPSSDTESLIFWAQARAIREGLHDLFNNHLVNRRKGNRATGSLKRSSLIYFRPKPEFQSRSRQTLQGYWCIPLNPQVLKVWA